MTSSNSIPSENRRGIEETMQTHWALFLAQGVIMMILGVLAMIWPQISTLAVDIYLGWMFLLSGIVGLATMFLAPSVSAFLWSLLTAALSLVVGVLLLWHPVEGTVSLTLVLIAFFIVRRNLSDRRCGEVSRHVPRFMGVDGDERDRRSDPGRADDQRVAGHRNLGAGIDRGCQPHQLRSGDHDGGTRRTRPRQNGGRDALTKFSGLNAAERCRRCITDVSSERRGIPTLRSLECGKYNQEMES